MGSGTPSLMLHLLIFDEPTSALDSESCQQFIELVNAIKNDKIIIIVSHEENMKKHHEKWQNGKAADLHNYWICSHFLLFFLQKSGQYTISNQKVNI